MADLPQANLLANETSPYLLQHKDNPVHWRPWGREALAEAERLNKPILLSIGYAACHWCHVMAHESFEDAETAALMNDLFVNIKLDREERPDIDAVFQTTAGVMGAQGGWPLTMFLTPRGEAYFATTYLPKTEAFGRPAFKTAMRDVAARYRDKGEEVARNTEVVKTALERLWHTNRRTENALTPQTLELASRRVCQQMDVFSGGSITAPKFPNVPQLELLWRSFLRTGAPQFRNALDTQLLHMCHGGIYDHLGGGFARYSVDEFWLVPHFEKMLYDNALLIDVLAQVWQDTGQAVYRARVEETIGWVLREMATPQGAFASSIDADSEGEEGKFYTWSAAEIDRILGPQDTALFRSAFDIRDAGNWDGRNIIHRLRSMAPLAPVEEGRLNAMRQKLLAERNKRQRPGFDDKILADWNGFMIKALMRASDAMNRLDWQAAAVRAFWFVADKMADGDRLYHSASGGRVGATGMADDYASMARAALSLYEATSDPRYLEKARAWIAVMNDFFWDKEHGGGYAMTPSDGENLTIRPRTVSDGPTPSANSIMADLLIRLFFITGDQSLRERGLEIINVFALDAMNNVSSHAGFFSAIDTIVRGINVVIIGDRHAPDTTAMRDVLRRHSMPNKIVTIMMPGQEFPPLHPAHGKGQVQARATAYFCSGQSCSAPIVDPMVLDQTLRPRFVQQARA